MTDFPDQEGSLEASSPSQQEQHDAYIEHMEDMGYAWGMQYDPEPGILEEFREEPEETSLISALFSILWLFILFTGAVVLFSGDAREVHPLFGANYSYYLSLSLFIANFFLILAMLKVDEGETETKQSTREPTERTQTPTPPQNQYEGKPDFAKEMENIEYKQDTYEKDDTHDDTSDWLGNVFLLLVACLIVELFSILYIAITTPLTHPVWFAISTLAAAALACPAALMLIVFLSGPLFGFLIPTSAIGLSVYLLNSPAPRLAYLLFFVNLAAFYLFLFMIPEEANPDETTFSETLEHEEETPPMIASLSWNNDLEGEYIITEEDDSSEGSFFGLFLMAWGFFLLLGLSAVVSGYFLIKPAQNLWVVWYPLAAIALGSTIGCLTSFVPLRTYAGAFVALFAFMSPICLHMFYTPDLQGSSHRSIWEQQAQLKRAENPIKALYLLSKVKPSHKRYFLSIAQTLKERLAPFVDPTQAKVDVDTLQHRYHALINLCENVSFEASFFKGRLCSRIHKHPVLRTLYRVLQPRDTEPQNPTSSPDRKESLWGSSFWQGQPSNSYQSEPSGDTDPTNKQKPSSTKKPTKLPKTWRLASSLYQKAKHTTPKSKQRLEYLKKMAQAYRSALRSRDEQPPHWVATAYERLLLANIDQGHLKKNVALYKQAMRYKRLALQEELSPTQHLHKQFSLCLLMFQYRVKHAAAFPKQERHTQARKTKQCFQLYQKLLPTPQPNPGSTTPSKTTKTLPTQRAPQQAEREALKAIIKTWLTGPPQLARKLLVELQEQLFPPSQIAASYLLWRIDRQTEKSTKKTSCRTFFQTYDKASIQQLQYTSALLHQIHNKKKITHTHPLPQKALQLFSKQPPCQVIRELVQDCQQGIKMTLPCQPTQGPKPVNQQHRDKR